MDTGRKPLCAAVGLAIAMLTGIAGCIEEQVVQDAGLDAPDAPDVPSDVRLDVPVIGGPFALEVATLEITVRQGETAILPLSIRRVPGFDDTVTITADGLPEGTHAPAVRDEPDEHPRHLELQASEDAATVQRAPFVISASGSGHRRTWRATIDVIAR